MLSENAASYADVAEALVSELRRSSPHDVALLSANESESPALERSALQIAVGAKACKTLLARESRVPVVCTLLPRASYDRLLALRGEGRKTSALFLDQPPRRQLALIRLAIPGSNKVAVLLPSEAQLPVGFEQAAQQLGMKLLVRRVETDAAIYPVLQGLLPDSDVLLSLPDVVAGAQVATQNVLLTALRFRVPVAGYSAGYVRAGAMFGVFTTPTQVGLETGEWARHYLANGMWQAPRHMRQFSVSVNRSVERYLALSVSDEAVLKDGLMAMEREP